MAKYLSNYLTNFYSMKFYTLFLFLPILIAPSSLKGMEQDIQKYNCENYLELLPPELYHELLNFKGEANPEVGFWLSKHKEPKLNSSFDSGMKNISCMAFDEAKNRFIIGSENGDLRSWKLNDKRYDYIFLENNTHPVKSLQIYKAKNQLLALLGNIAIGQWDLGTNNKMQNIEPPARGHLVGFSSMLLDEDNHRLFIGQWSGKIIIHDLVTNQTINTFQATHSDFVTCLALDIKRKRLITGSSYDVHPTIWDISNNTYTKTPNSPYKETTSSLLIDSENNRLISLLTSGILTITSLDTNRLTHKINMLVKIPTFIFEKLYNRLILGLNGGDITLFDLTANAPTFSFSYQPAEYRYSQDNVSISSLIQNSNQLIAGVENGQIAIFDLYDPDMKKTLDTTLRFKTHHALMKAYEYWTKRGAIKNTLDLSCDTLLHSGFFALPKALQQVIHKTITVNL